MFDLRFLTQPSERSRVFFTRKSVYAFSAALIGAILFFLIYGYATLCPTNVSFLYNSTDADVFNHQLGFDFFRISPWRWPIGVQSIYPYPFDSSVIYSDSIPLFAFIFKLFAPVLPEYFQYFGIWIFLCFVLQGVSASLLLKKLGISYIRSMLIVPFFIINVPLLFRCFHHSALAGQWLILLSFLMVLSESAMKTGKRIVLWCLLCGGSILIHGYLFFICGFLMSFSNFYQFFKNKKRRSSIAVFFSCVLISLFSYYIAGGFLPHDNVVMRGFPNFVFDPVDLINPLVFSSFLPRIRYVYSTESAVYLGLAFMILLLISLVILFIKRRQIGPFFKKHRFFVTLTILASLFLFVISEGLRPRIGGHILFDLVGSDPDYELLGYLSTFRATSRFILPVWYLMQICVFYVLHRSIRSPRIFIYILLPCIVLQYVEVVPRTAKGRADSIKNGYHTEFNDCFDDVFNENARHLSFISNTYENIAPAAVFAFSHNMSLNNSKACRGPKNSVQADIDAWNSGQLPAETVYLIPEQILAFMKPLSLPDSYKIYYCEHQFCVFHEDLMKKAPLNDAIELDPENLYSIMESIYDPELNESPVSTYEEF